MKHSRFNLDVGREKYTGLLTALRIRKVDFQLMRWTCQAVLLLGVCLAGCGAEKATLFEEEHDLPAHWPSGLGDAADKIEQRLEEIERLTSRPNSQDGQSELEHLESELRDLVNWIPEVAADTDVSEDQWLPVYDLCEVMRAHLKPSDVSALDIKDDFRKLQSLLIKLASHLPSADSAKQGDFDHDESNENRGGSIESPPAEEFPKDTTGTGDAS